ncbi:MAG: hypothetical protein U0228_10860 [Myxococcaceae bacterium]
MAANADVVTFSRGALIIPMNSTWQTKCGQISAYGLVYRILEANGPGHRNAGSPVTVYLVDDPGKSSPNRCKPTNTIAFDAAVPSQGDPKWNDGCDMVITNAVKKPVVRVDYTAAWPAPGSVFNGETGGGNTLNTFVDGDAWPKWQALTAANKENPALTTVRYGGAPFVIDAPDAQKVFDLLVSGDTGANAFPVQATNRFTTTCACPAAGPSTTTATSGALTYSNGCHFVDMHQATTSFSANVERRFNTPPKSFALYDPDYGTGSGTSYDGNRANVLLHLVLERYLKISGLWLRGTGNGQDSVGCPVGNVSGCTFNGSTAAAIGTPATAVQAKPGVVFDRFTTEDLVFTNGTYPSGLLNQKDVSNRLVYSLFWAPHWVSQNNARGNDNNSMTSIQTFLNTGGNVMGECASIDSWENTLNGVTAPQFLNTAGIDFTGVFGTITVSPYTSNNMKNCTDPGAAAPCVDFLLPGNVFSQVGDWMFDDESGYLETLRPKAASSRRPFNGRMLVFRNDATLTDDVDIFNMGQETAAKGVLVYVGGHDVSGNPLGARIVLNSMLNLGGSPIPSERALAGPTIVLGSATVSPASLPAWVDLAVTPTFDAVSGYSSNPAVQTFTTNTTANQAMWVWPYYPGHFRAHAMSALSAGSQIFASGQIFDSSTLSAPTGISPKPPNRNLFTWVGGYPKSVGALAGGAPARNNVAQVGWTPETISGMILDRTGACPIDVSSCVDVIGLDARVGAPVYDGLDPGLHIVRGADGLCDIQEVLNVSKINSGNDWGTPANCNPNNIKRFVDDSPYAAWLYQRVRGYCYTGGNTNYTPTDAQCTDNNDNRAHLGGLVRSTAAIMTPSSKIQDNGAPRPTVSFVGGYDGQLHAFYVGGGQGYTGPTTANWNEDNEPTLKFATVWNFAVPPAAGTELWSFLPASQLPWLDTNGAKVDSSPVVMDVFADFKGTGLREWHSVLLVSVGRQGTELFALDVTNPLKPRMLWDHTGSLFQSGATPAFSPNILMNDTTNALPGTKVFPKYQTITNGAFPTGYEEKFVENRKAYDLRDLGGSSGLSSSQIRVGLEPVYVVYVASNMAKELGTAGLEVYAIEVSTGQVMWQWERVYDSATAPSDNAVPPVATVLPGADGASRVIIGDMEGRVWELDAATGRNVNVSVGVGACTVATPCYYPGFDTGSTNANPQPITTNVAIARVPTTTPVGGALYPYRGERVVVFGTSGADWITSPSTVPGNLHVGLYDTLHRIPVTAPGGFQLDLVTPWTAANVLAIGKVKGVFQEPTAAGFPLVQANGERFFGQIVVAGEVVYFNTATDNISDVMNVTGNIAGKLKYITLSAAAGSLVNTAAGAKGSYGGPAIYYDPGNAGQTKVLTSQSSDLNYMSQTGAADTASRKQATQKVGYNQGFTYRFMSWLRRVLQ